MSSASGPLSSGWVWKRFVKETDDVATLTVPDEEENECSPPSVDSWSKCHTFPTDIYAELIHAGLIEDPFIGFNEHLVQWVADEHWIFAARFKLEHFEEVMHGVRRAEIVFDGLDTFCTIYLNGKMVHQTDNMFVTSKISLNTGSPISQINTILLVFTSCKRMAKQIEAQHGCRRAGSCNLGDPSRVYVRKAQYHFRWDWGPELVTSGPWKPITLNTFTSRISELESSALVDVQSLETCLTLVTKIESVRPMDFMVEIVLRDDKGSIVWSDHASLDGEQSELVTEWKFAAGDIQLWWPSGYGEATLYELSVTLLTMERVVLDRVLRRIGFRDTKLCQERLINSPGTSFYLRVNGIKIFLGGSNWIPADSFLTRVGRDKYRSWLSLLKDGNQNCVRVWGGGIYEDDAFYDICDELGILVWQDFAFACGVYPAHTSFIDSVRLEAECNIRRLRHHPSLVLLCGGNENYQQITQWEVEGGLPAAIIHEKLLPSLVRKLVRPPIPYVFDSPYGGEGWDTSSPLVGDVHQWNVWAGSGQPYQDYDILGGRFISEFGVPSLPCMLTVQKFFPEDEPTAATQKYPQSQAMQQHTKAGSYERRFATLMNENFRLTGDLESYVYLTQLMQSEALGGAYRVWRRKWAGDGNEETGGVLVWQLNDCWPATSWAIVDYFLRPKPAFYAIARELKTITVAITRNVQKNRPNDRPRAFYEFGAFQSVAATLDVWATNAGLSATTVEFQLKAFDLESDWTFLDSRTVELRANSSTEIISSLPCPHRYQQEESPRIPHPSYSVVYAAFLTKPETGELLSQHIDWPQPLKFIEPRDPDIRLELSGNLIIVSVEYPVKGLVLSVPGREDEVRWSDNCIDILPGYPYKLQATGIAGRPIHAAYLGREKAHVLQRARDGQ